MRTTAYRGTVSMVAKKQSSDVREQPCLRETMVAKLRGWLTVVALESDATTWHPRTWKITIMQRESPW